MALTKAEIADELMFDLKMNKRDAKEMVDLVFEEIRSTLSSGKPVKISGFGNWELRDKGERPGRNPRTGEDIPITARRVVTFKSSQKLKSRIEETSEDEKYALTEDE